MEEFKILTFKEISDALNAGKGIEVEGCGSNPFKIVKGSLVDIDENPYSVSYDIHHAMTGLEKARIIESKLTRWIVVHRYMDKLSDSKYDSEKEAKCAEKYWKANGIWLRTVKVEV